MERNQFKDQYIKALPKIPEGLDLGLDKFNLYDISKYKSIKLNKSDSEFLSNVGMPNQAAPFLSFNPVCDWDFQPDNYFALGADGNGSPICIEYETGFIVLLDHDWDMKKVFINSSLIQFAESLCMYRSMLTNEKLNNCFESMCKIDGKLKEDGQWWLDQIKYS